MTARTTAGRGLGRRLVVPTVLVSLVAGLGSLVPASQAALAASQRVASISAGGDHTCAVISGNGYCWGENYNGELGDGTHINSGLPAAVDASGVLAGRTLTQISAGYEHTCGLDAAGAAYCWGRNSYGQLGDGSTSSTSVPVAVDTRGVLAGQAMTQITAGWYDTCALDATVGTVYCWGRNSYGQLGDGSTSDSSVPVAVDTGGALAGKTLTQVSAGMWHTCALDAAGAPYCWGRNASGELGDDSYSPSAVPVLVGL
jgi:alpha-tubulin suppressor-like RCC1 family protein